MIADSDESTGLRGSSRPSLPGVPSGNPFEDNRITTPHSTDGSQFLMVRNNPSTRVMVRQNLPALVAKLRGDVPERP